MAISVTLSEVAALAAQLSPPERQGLAKTILQELASAQQQEKPRRLWREIRGIVPCPLFGEDAQAWVSRTRSDSDEQRELPRNPSQ